MCSLRFDEPRQGIMNYPTSSRGSHYISNKLNLYLYNNISQNGDGVTEIMSAPQVGGVYWPAETESVCVPAEPKIYTQNKTYTYLTKNALYRQAQVKYKD